MKVLFVFLALAVLTASAGHLELCGFNTQKLARVTLCIELKASKELRLTLAKARYGENCLTDICLFRKLCEQGELGETLKTYLTDEEIEELHEIAEECER
ncbi:antimicrobial peptide microplusin-like [Amblyomma americanum]